MESDPDTSPDPRQTQAWGLLEKHASETAGTSLRELLASPEERYQEFSIMLDGMCADFSRCRATTETIRLLTDLAGELGLQQRIDALFGGQKVNNTEARAALHTSLRAATEHGPEVDGADIGATVHAERERYLRFADAVSSGRRTAPDGRPFATVINIGIGGSDLGPRFIAAALADPADDTGPEVHFVAGLDGQELRQALRQAEPATTLFVICSKTFTTLETLSNAVAARAWLAERLPETDLPRHFAAVSVSAGAMDEFGVADDARFAMWDWVGGRYSVWSPVGLSAAVALGSVRYRELLAGAARMDEHFRSAAPTANIPVLHGLLAVWQQNFLGLDQHLVLPYDQRLNGLPDYLQQLWMESLGKSVRRDGTPADYPTGASLWGNNGSCAQHSFAQWLHQGSARAVVDYIATVNGPDPADERAHLESLANMLAQAEVLALGQHSETASDALAAHRRHPGDRPSTVLVLKDLTPRILGMLLALYEHSVYVQSIIWGINAFDQFGVERGKQVARGYADMLLQQNESRLPPVAGQIMKWRANKS